MLHELTLLLVNRTMQFPIATGGFKEAGVNVLGFYMEPENSYTVRLICHPTDKAKEEIKRRAYGVSENQVLAVSAPDEPGQLSSITQLMDSEGIGILYGYSSAIKYGSNNAVVIVNTDNNDAAKKILEKNGYIDLDETALQKLLL